MSKEQITMEECKAIANSFSPNIQFTVDTGVRSREVPMLDIKVWREEVLLVTGVPGPFSSEPAPNILCRKYVVNTSEIVWE